MKNFKEIKLIKPNAKTEILFKSDSDDDWFIAILTVEKKSGKFTRKLIIQKDVEGFLSLYKDNGWIISDGTIIKKIKKLPTKTKSRKK